MPFIRFLPRSTTFRTLSSLAVATSLVIAPALAAAQGPETLNLGRFWGTLAITNAVVTAPPILAQASVEASAADGTQFVRSLGDEVIVILKNNDTVDRRKEKFRTIFSQAFDVESMAQFAAGNYWRRADDRQKQEYIKLFGDYVASLYANKFADYAGQSFKVTGERPAGDNGVAVEGTIIQGQKPPVRIDFRLRKIPAGYKIIDVYVEGMSLLITKRDEFMTVLSREGMDGLLQRLRATSQG